MEKLPLNIYNKNNSENFSVKREGGRGKGAYQLRLQVLSVALS